MITVGSNLKKKEGLLTKAEISKLSRFKIMIFKKLIENRSNRRKTHEELCDELNRELEKLTTDSKFLQENPEIAKIIKIRVDAGDPVSFSPSFISRAYKTLKYDKKGKTYELTKARQETQDLLTLKNHLDQYSRNTMHPSVGIFALECQRDCSELLARGVKDYYGDKIIGHTSLETFTIFYTPDKNMAKSIGEEIANLKNNSNK